MNEIWNRVEELAKLVEKGYKNISITNSEERILTSTYSDIPGDYIQFAYKFIMPRWVFEGNASNNEIAREYANALNYSEILYLIKKMEESQKSKTIYSINDINFKELHNYFLSLENVTHLFIPAKLASSKNFCYNSYFEIVERGRYIQIGAKKLRLHMSKSELLPFDKIFVLDSSGVKWSQKKVKDMNISRAKDPEGLKLLTKEDGILQLSAKINDDDSVLFLMRLVAGAVIDPNKVKMINMSN